MGSDGVPQGGETIDKPVVKVVAGAWHRVGQIEVSPEENNTVYHLSRSVNHRVHQEEGMVFGMWVWVLVLELIVDWLRLTDLPVGDGVAVNNMAIHFDFRLKVAERLNLFVMMTDCDDKRGVTFSVQLRFANTGRLYANAGVAGKPVTLRQTKKTSTK